MIGSPFYTIYAAVKGRVSQRGVVGAETLNYYNKALQPPSPEPPVPPIPVYSGTADFTAFINVLSRSSEDLLADITVGSGTKNLYGIIFGYLSTYNDLSGRIKCVLQGTHDVYGSVRTVQRSNTEPLRYVDTILSTKGGISIIHRQLTKTPDITASVYGWDVSDLAAKIIVFGTSGSNLYANIAGWDSSYKDINATLVSMYIHDIAASLDVVLPHDIYADIFSVTNKDIIGSIVGYRPADLYAYCGTSQPKVLYAYLSVTQPVDIRGYIICGLSGYSNLSSDITIVGGMSGIGAFLKAKRTSYSDMFASLTVKLYKDMRAYISGWAETDITAYIKGWNGKDLSASIWASYIDAYSDLGGFIRVSYEGQEDVKTFIHGWISTHTSDKPYNLHLIRKPPRKVLLGLKKGLVIFEMEPVYGYFPDLHATINAIAFYSSYLGAFIRSSEREVNDISTSLSPVSKYVCMSKVAINFVNLSNLYADISAFSAYKDLGGFIIGKKSASTSTSANAGWVYRSLSIKFFMGTSGGLFIPSLGFNRIRTDMFINNSDSPDLWAYVRGWCCSDISCYLNVQPSFDITASVVSQDLSHIKYLYATLYPTRYVELLAEIVGIGGFTDISASVLPYGRVSDIGASIYPYLVSAGYRIIRIDTKPYKDLYSDINMGYTYGISSGYKDLEAFIRGSATYSVSALLGATICSTTDVNNISATVTGRKVSRIRTLRFDFRPLNRSYADFYSIIVGTKVAAYDDVYASIFGDYLTSDLLASIYPVYYRVSAIEPDIIKVYKQSNQMAYLYRKLKLSLHSKTDSYIYDSIQKAIYSMGDGRWILKLSELSDTGLFYDKNTNDREKLIDDISEYGSIDEAIRMAISWLSDMNKYDMTASIIATGGVSAFYATIYGRLLDAQRDIITKIVPVINDPILYAEIEGVL